MSKGARIADEAPAACATNLVYSMSQINFDAATVHLMSINGTVTWGSRETDKKFFSLSHKPVIP